MPQHSITYRNITTWWLSINLLLGLLLFTGHTGKTMARHIHPVQVAWLQNSRSSISKYAHWFKQPLSIIVIARPVADYKNSLSCYHGLIRVILIRSAHSVTAINTSCYLQRQQSYPEDPEALIFHS